MKLAPLLGNATPDVLTVEGKNKIQLQNVVVGEVWICSGQSNMDFPLHRAEGGPAAMQAESGANIRLFFVPRVRSDEPLTDIRSQWLSAGPTTLSNFSAVAYFFGRDLQKALNVPVGVIQASWGGSTAEAWINRKTIETSTEFSAAIIGAYPSQMQNYREAKSRYDREADAAARENRAPALPQPMPPWKIGRAHV